MIEAKTMKAHKTINPLPVSSGNPAVSNIHTIPSVHCKCCSSLNGHTSTPGFLGHFCKDLFSTVSKLLQQQC